MLPSDSAGLQLQDFHETVQLYLPYLIHSSLSFLPSLPLSLLPPLFLSLSETGYIQPRLASNANGFPASASLVLGF